MLEGYVGNVCSYVRSTLEAYVVTYVMVCN